MNTRLDWQGLVCFNVRKGRVERKEETTTGGERGQRKWDRKCGQKKRKGGREEKGKEKRKRGARRGEEEERKAAEIINRTKSQSPRLAPPSPSELHTAAINQFGPQSIDAIICFD